MSRIAAVATALTAVVALASSPPTVAAGTEASSEPLQVAVTIHVEGYREERANEDLFDKHVGMLKDLAEAASSAGAALTFDLSETFVAAARSFSSSFASDVVAMGHAVGVHADLGGTPLSLPTFTRRLRRMRTDVEALGVEVTHVSGICSESPWVEAAIQAGYDAVTGMVEFCYKSLDAEHLPPEHADAASCTTPSDCHDPAPADLSHQVHPWRTSDSGDWLEPDPTGRLVLVAGVGGTSATCTGDLQDPGGCSGEVTEPSDLSDLLDIHLAARDPERVGALTVTWSVGAPPDIEKAAEIFKAAKPYVEAGAVRWATIPAIAALVP